jgi:hypothetical protein
VSKNEDIVQSRYYHQVHKKIVWVGAAFIEYRLSLSILFIIFFGVTANEHIRANSGNKIPEESPKLKLLIARSV